MLAFCMSGTVGNVEFYGLRIHSTNHGAEADSSSIDVTRGLAMNGQNVILSDDHLEGGL